MNRLTSNTPLTEWEAMNMSVTNLCERLKKYEDTGLEPEEIDGIKALSVLGIMSDVKRANAIMDAEREGRLLILPCKVGDTVFWVPDMKKSDWIIEDTVIGFIVEENGRIRLMLPGLCMEPIYPQTHLFLTREEAEAALRGGADG